MNHDVVIIGAGMSGLACARVLHNNNHKFIVLEASDKPGGRIRTENIDGYLLDHGFQVLQTGYPELSHLLELSCLNLHSFPSGVAVRKNGNFHIIADPRSHPGEIISTLTSPLGTLRDRFLMFRLSRLLCKTAMTDIFKEKDEKALDFLDKFGFSERFISSFFVPFFAGACLERQMSASSRVLKYLIRVFSMGNAALPANGMGSIPDTLAAELPPGVIQYNKSVVEIDGNVITLQDGETMRAQQIILATQDPVVNKLLHLQVKRKSVGETCVYFGTDWKPPFRNPFLVLNGDDEGPINNLAFPSLVSPRYAPHGKTLISAVVLDEQIRKRGDIEELVRKQCSEWFGSTVSDWVHLKSMRIDHALPDQSPPTPDPYQLPEPIGDSLRVCGEHQGIPGLQWALMSGQMTGQDIVSQTR